MVALGEARPQREEGPSAGEGAVFAWAGNSQIGEGRMTLTQSRPAELIRIKLDFVQPMRFGSAAFLPTSPARVGETIDIGDRTKTELEVLEDGEEDQTWRVKSLPQFEKFLELYTRSFKRSLTIDAKRRKDLMGRVDNGIADLRAVLQNDRNRGASRLERAEPIFIFPLRELVLMMNEAGETLA